MPTLFTLDGDTPDLWMPQRIPATPAGIASFSLTDDAPDDAESVWRIDLPADLPAADALLKRAEQAVANEQAALQTAKERMEALKARVQSGVASFSVPQTAADAELFDLLAQAGADDGGALSFAAGDGGWRSAVAEFEQFSDMVRDLIGGAARVETAIGAALIGSTRVGLTGNLRTMLGAPDDEQMMRHQRAVALMLAKRGALLRTVAVALSGAAGLASLVGRPDGIIRAVPAALRYIRSLRAELGALDAIDPAAR